MTSRNKPLIVLAAGGTGGHVFPAEALATELADRNYRLILVTDRRGSAFPGILRDIETYRIHSSSVSYNSIPSFFKSGFKLATGLFQAIQLLRKLKPCVVVGFGGYASVPTMLAACLGIYPTLIHEQNAVLGRANRLLARLVSKIATSFTVVEGLPGSVCSKVLDSGMPVRSDIIDFHNSNYQEVAPENPFQILVIGGSQGARVFSDVVPVSVAAMPESVRKRLKVVQQCRPEDIERVQAMYISAGVNVELATFFNDLPARLATTHLVIARAGASTIAELTTIGRPSILVPYPYAVDNHQARNANVIDEAGAGWVLAESSISAEKLRERLELLLGMPSTLERAAANAKALGRPEAVKKLADMVISLTHDTNISNKCVA